MAATESPQFPEWVPGVEIDHVSAARTHLTSIFPEASLNPSSPEMTLIEALAVVIGPVALAYQNAPAALTEYLMGLYGLFRYEGRMASGKVRFFVSTQSDFVQIPSGTLLRYYASDEAGTLEFRTTETVTIVTSESLEGTAYIEATEMGTTHNGLPVGTPLDMVGHHLQIESVAVSETTRGGEGVESDESFDQRAMAMLSRQTNALVYPDNFEDAVLTREEVGRAFTVNNYDATDSTTKVGHVTVAVTDTTGNPLPEADRDEIEDWLQAQALASLVVHTADPTYTTVNLTATVEAVAGANTADVQAAVKAELDARLDPAKWNWWKDITVADVITWIDDVPGVARVISVPAGATLTGAAPLPRPGSHTITVNTSTR